MSEQLELFPAPPPPSAEICHWCFCWPDWEGPKVGERCSCSDVFAFNVTRGRDYYLYCAPVRVEIVAWGEFVEGLVEYDHEQFVDGTTAVALTQGERVRLPWKAVWPCVPDQWRVRAEQERLRA